MSGYLGDIDYSAGILPGTTQQVDPSHPGAAGSTGAGLGTGTGKYGYQTVAGGSMGHPFLTAWQWLQRPLTTPMSPITIFQLIGIVLVGILLWNLVLYHIRVAAEAI